MAIEIITRGVPLVQRKYMGACTNCKSVLSFEGSDMVAGSKLPEPRLLCPVCGFETSINEWSDTTDVVAVVGEVI